MDLLKIERVCHGHDEPDLRIVILQDPGRLKDIREEGADLSDTAPREETDHWLVFVDAISMNGFFQWPCVQDLVNQRMAYKRAIHPGLLVNRLFKGEYHDHLLYPLGQEAQPSFFPCPYLRTDVIDHRYAVSLCHSGDPDIEARIINQDHKVGAAGPDKGCHNPIGPEDGRQPRQDL